MSRSSLIFVIGAGAVSFAVPAFAATPPEVPSGAEDETASRVLTGDDEVLEEIKDEEGDGEGGPAAVPESGLTPRQRRIRARPTRFGPFILGAEEASFQPTFASQFIGDLEALDGQEVSASGSVRRNRLGFRARLRDDLVIVRMQMNLWIGNVEMLDLFVDVGPHRWFAARVGQFKVPFTRYRLQSFTALSMVDWALASNYYGAERQAGLSFHGGDLGFEYDAGIFSGANRRASHGVGAGLIYGERGPNPSNLVDPSLPAEVHPEAVVHAAYRSDEADAGRLSDRRGGDTRYAVDLSFAWDFAPVVAQDLRFRLAPEVLLKWEHLGWHFGWYQTWHQRTNGVTGLGPWGPLTEASYRFDRTFELAARYEFIRIPDGMLGDARRRADRLIADASDPTQAEALTDRYRGVGLVDRQHELGGGLNVRFVGDSLKLQSDFRYVRSHLRDPSLAARNDYIARLQLQVAF